MILMISQISGFKPVGINSGDFVNGFQWIALLKPRVAGRLERGRNQFSWFFGSSFRNFHKIHTKKSLQATF